MRDLALVLLSGGLDSTTGAALAKQQGYELVALTVHYGQAHGREIQSARRVAAALGIAHQVVEVAFCRDLAWYSALTSSERFAPPTDRITEAMSTDIPIIREIRAIRGQNSPALLNRRVKNLRPAGTQPSAESA